MARTESGTRMQKGDIAPDFSLQGVDGKIHSLENLISGKQGILILFICNHCPYVKARTTEMVGIYDAFKDSIAVVAINSSDPEYPGEGIDNMKAFARERGFTFPYLIDESGSVAKAYGATCTPDPFLFDAGLQLIFHGRLTDALEPQDASTEFTMRDNIEKLLKNEPIDPWFNPSLGCSIKFKAA